MEPRVPFALLAAAEMLGVAGWAALAGAAGFPGIRRLSGLAVIPGALLLGLADAVTGAGVGTAASPTLGLLRAVGAVLVALGLIAGAPGSRGRRGGGRGALPPAQPLPALLRARPATPLLAIAPLSAGLPVSLAGAGALAVAGVLAVRRPAAGRWPLGVGLLADGGALALAPAAATSSTAAVALLALRAAAALVVLAAVVLLARGSVLAKVVTAIVSSVVVTAVATASVVGGAVTDRLGAQQADQVTRVVQADAGALTATEGQAGFYASVLASVADPTALLGGTLASCSGSSTFAVEVNATQVTHVYRGAACPGSPIDQLALDTLPDDAIVRTIIRTASREPAQGIAILHSGRAYPVALGVAPVLVGGQPTGLVRVYGAVLDATVLSSTRASTTFDASVYALSGALPGGLVSSSLEDPRPIATDSRLVDIAAEPPEEGAVVVRLSQGSEPTLAVTTLSVGAVPVALLVVSAPAEVVVGVQRTVLSLLFGALLVIGFLVAGLGLVLGGQVVRPVLQLTEVAEAVRRGDLTATAVKVRATDEVGRLARTFDAMTATLRQANDELRLTAEEESSLRARLEVVLASITEGLVVADADGIVTSVNRAGEELVGASALAVGLPVRDVVRGTAGDGTPLAAAVGRALEGTLLRPGEEAGPAAGVPVIASTSPLSGGTGVVVVLRDQMRERQVDRMKTEFLANVSHELRTPLTPIQGYAEILRRRELPTEKTQSYAGIVVESAKRLARVVDLLVDVAALDGGRVVPQPTPVSLGEVIDDRLTIWRGRAPERAADLRRRVSPRLAPALVDVHWLSRAMDELVDNALKFSAPGAPVTLSASVEPMDGRLRLAVRDAGEGVPDGARAALLSDFVQADGSATRTRDGLGLGLAFVRRVAAVVDLELQVDSVRGRGATFSLVMGADPAAEVPTRPRRATTRRPAATPAPSSATTSAPSSATTPASATTPVPLRPRASRRARG